MRTKSYLDRLLLKRAQPSQNSEICLETPPSKPTEPTTEAVSSVLSATALGIFPKKDPASVEQCFDDEALADMVLAKFPGSQFLGTYPRGAFQGPMLELPDIRRCPVCSGTKHWRVTGGEQICTVCNPTAHARTEDDSAQPDFFRGEEK